MQKLLRFAAAAAFALALASPAAAGDLRLTIADGRVTLIAHDVPVRDILAEWARVGQTRIVNGEKLIGAPVTLQLENVPEAQALDTLLRSASGYILAPRSAETPGPSLYDRIMILATSRPPAATPPPAPFNRAFVRPQPPVVPDPAEADDPDDDDDDPDVAPPPQGMPVPPANAMPVPGPQPTQNQTPMTLPQPGMLPQPPQQPAVPGASPNPEQNPGVNAVPGVPPRQPGDPYR
jgi:hypothetical protein